VPTFTLELVWLPLVVPPLGVDCPLECDVTELPLPVEVEVPDPPPEFAVVVMGLVGTVTTLSVEVLGFAFPLVVLPSSCLRWKHRQGKAQQTVD